MHPSIKKLFKKTITEFIKKRNESLAGLKLGKISLDETKNPEKKFLGRIHLQNRMELSSRSKRRLTLPTMRLQKLKH